MSMIDFHSLAKTELHCHLDGSLSLPTIRQLAALANIDLPASDEELKHHVTAPAHCENLLDYLEAFDYIRPLLQTKETLTLAAYDVAKQAALENVLYIEVRFAPELSMDQGLTSRILAEANQVRDQEFVGFDFAGDEHNYSPEDIRPLIEQVKSYHRPMTLHAGECHCHTL